MVAVYSANGCFGIFIACRLFKAVSPVEDNVNKDIPSNRNSKAAGRITSVHMEV